MGMGAIMTPGIYPIQTPLMQSGIFTPFKMPIQRSANEWVARGFGWDGGYGACAYWDLQNGVTVIFVSPRLVESPLYSEIFQKFFDSAYAAAGV